MSKLEQLIARLCPNGVEFVELGKYVVRTRGTNITASQMKVLHKENAPVKIFAGGKAVACFGYGDLPEKDINTKPSITETLRIPLPPLPVQNEIVKILDNFTKLTAELTAELAKELTARKKTI